MAQILVKALLVLLCINVVLYTGGVRVVGSDGESFLSDFVDINDTQVVVSNQLGDALPTQLEGGGGFLAGVVAGIERFIDSIGAVKKVIFFIVNIVFTPLGLFMAAGMPQIITLMIGVPLMVVLFLGVAYFIRSGS